MQNTELKSELVQNGVYDAFCWNVFLNRLKHIYNDNAALYGLTEDQFKACTQLRDSKKKTWSRLGLHIAWLFKRYPEKVYFLTLTFNDRSMGFKAEYRRDLVGRTLNAHCEDYIANVDYGKLNEREHFHAVVVANDIVEEERDGKKRFVSPWLDEYASKYGYYKVEIVGITPEDTSKLSRYIAKLCNHSIKVKQTKIMTKKNSEYHHLTHGIWAKDYKGHHSDELKKRLNTMTKLDEIFGSDGWDLVESQDPAVYDISAGNCTEV